MNRIALVTIAGIFALSACSGGGSTAGHTSVQPSSARSIKMAPYQIPTTTSAAAQASEKAAKAKKKPLDDCDPNNDYGGGAPDITGDLDFLDAPNFGPGAQINLAIVGVNAISNGSAYSLVTYDTAVVINTLDFQRQSLSLGSNSIPAIAYDGLQIVIDPSQSSVVSNGQTYPMTFGTFNPQTFAFQPSAAGIQSINFSVPFNGSQGNVHLLMDFNGVDSIALVNGVAQVSPALIGANAANSAVIGGSVVNNAGAPVVNATIQALNADGSVAATTVSANDGSFELHAINAGNYQVVVSNSFVPVSGQTVSAIGADGAAPLTAIPVSVPAGYRADLGQIQD